MNEIEKMYENCGIKPELHKFPGRDWDDEGLASWYEEKFYPPFTAEKQLAILQLLTQRRDLTISHFTKGTFIHFDGQEPLEMTGKDFTETFARLINVYWQSLTEEEKEQIRGILK